ncbi:MAG: 5-formyltetrahydrofolate cyclo-ligase [Bdellovibrionales bacterium]|nr:5-formyltetrahydrofolate cyclo-ligase [Bdellovibrionales bacterium]
MSSIASAKAELRARIRARRRGVSPTERSMAEQLLADRAKPLVASLARGTRICAYRSLGEEIGTDAVWNLCIVAGLTLLFPRVTSEAERTLEWVEWAGARSVESAPWYKGAHGVLEPCASLPGVSTPDAKVLFIPGVAFTEEGHRLGMGKGYYDAVLDHRQESLAVALAFDFQLVPDVPLEPWDRGVDWILTESREIRACRPNALTRNS